MLEVGVVDYDDPRYPERLKEIPDAPKQLYYRGVWDEGLFEHCLAVVGARKMSHYGEEVTETFAGGVAATGVTIVSGFMFGVDAAAHRAALAAGGRTIAVMPCSVNVIHPGHQKKLYHQIIDCGGLIISETDTGFEPRRWTFVRRNRIVAGLSQATLVVEAALKSGSLVTAALARRYRRELYAVPGPVTSEVSQGCNQLIRQGARMALEVDDLLAVYDKHMGVGQGAERHMRDLDPLERKIMDALERGAMDIDTLSRSVAATPADTGICLSMLMLEGLVVESGGKLRVARGGVLC